MKALVIAGVNLRRFLRDRSNVFFVFILPIGIVLLIGAQFGGDSAPEIGFVGPGPGVSGEIRAALDERNDIRVVDFANEEDLIGAVERGGVSAGVLVPVDTDTAVAGGGPASIGFVARPDGLGPQLRAVVAEAVAEASLVHDAARYVIGLGVDPAVATDTVARAAVTAPGLDVVVVTAGDSLFPASLGRFDIGASSQLVLFMFLTGLAGSAAVIQTRKLGVAARMLSTPTPVRTVVAGEALGRFAIVLVQGLYIAAATVVLFRVDWGDPLAASAVLVTFAAVGAGAALLFGTMFSNDQQAGGVGVVAGLGLAALGGSMLPLELFSDSMRRVARLTPHSWANQAFADLVRRDGTLVDVLPEIGILLMFAVAFLVVATWRMRQIIART